MKEVRVEWYDAKTWFNAWMDNDECKSLTLPLCVTTGTILREDSDAIFIVQTVADDERRNIIGIPQGCIIKRTELDSRQ